MTRERISRILELREILLSIQTGFSLVNAAVVGAILESISGLEPPSLRTEPRYFKLVTVSSVCPFTFVVCHQLGLPGTDLHAVGCGGFVSAKVGCGGSAKFTSPSSSPAKPSMSSAKRRLVIVLPPMLTMPS